jgi:hypothetical protein
MAALREDLICFFAAISSLTLCHCGCTIRASTAPTGTTGCHQNSHWHYTLPLDSALGKNMYALLLSVVATGQPIGLAGSGVCNEYTPLNNGVESLRAIGVIF